MYPTNANISKGLHRRLIELKGKLAQGNELVTALDNVGIGAGLMDRKLHLLWCNKPVVVRNGEVEIGAHCYQTIHNRQEPCPGCLVVRTFETGEPQAGMVTCRTRTGGFRDYRVSTTPVVDADDGVVGVIEVIHEVIECQDIQHQLSRYRSLIDNATDFMAICDEDLRFLVVNRSILNDLGYSMEELVGRSILDIVAPEETQKAEAMVETLRARGVAPGVASLIRRNGSAVPTAICITYDKQQNVCEVVARDISHRLEMEEALRKRSDLLEIQNRRVLEAVQDRDRLLRSVSHELRTPLTSIVGFAELMQEDEGFPLSPSQQRALDRILNSSRDMLEQVNDLLDLSRLEAGKSPVAMATVRIEDLLHQVAEGVMPLALDKGLALSVSAADDLPDICTDAARLSQILTNLLSNAIKFTAEGEVSLKASARDSVVAVSVSDTGIGIPLGDQPNIFKEFYQASNSSGGKHGTGLGLAISQKLAGLLGGKILLESRPGKGSTFTLVLPVDGHSGPGNDRPDSMV